MMIISEGTPMTNGEVLALLRRRRDERNAKMQPPFGLHFVGSGSTSQMQQQRALLSAAAGNSAQTRLFFPPDVLLEDVRGAGAAGATTSALSRLPGVNSAQLVKPTASHLIVLLTEVRALRYLSRYGTISGVGGVHALYGPSSVQNCRHRVEKGATTNDDEESAHPHADDVSAGGDGALKSQEEAMARMVRQYRPGSVGCVRAVDALLHLWESKGREAERCAAAKVKSVLRALTQRSGNSTNDNGDAFSLSHDEEGELRRRQRPSPLDRPRLLFAPPSVPLALFLAEQSPTTAVPNRDGGGAASGVTSPSSPKNRQWTEQDVFRLVMARPRDSLDVHRVVDGVDELVGLDEKLLSFVEEELVKAFL